MRKMIVTVVLAAVVMLAFMPTASKATPPAGTNILGCYTEATNLGVCHQEAALAGPVAFYICLSGCSFGASGIAGYEFQVVQNGATVAIQAYNTMGTALNIGVPPEFICGLAAPLTPNGDDMIVIMEVTGLSFGGEDSFSLAPISGTQSIPGEMAVVNALDAGDKQIATATSGTGIHEGISYGVNTGPIHALPVDESTWGDIKSLYR